MDLINDGIETNCDVYFAFTVQEETGLRGPAIVAEQVNADMAIAVETTTSGDDPELEKQLWSTHLGNGPAITFMHSGYVVSKAIFDKLVETAKQNNIPFQYKMRTVGGTNARRYTHLLEYLLELFQLLHAISTVPYLKFGRMITRIAFKLLKAFLESE